MASFRRGVRALTLIRHTCSALGGSLTDAAALDTTTLVIEAKTGRALTEGERALLRSLFADHIDYDAARVFGRKWQFFQPKNVAMAPNGNVYFPPAHYLPDYSLPSLPLRTRAWFAHEGAHLYQHYGLRWNVIVRGAISRRYSYTLTLGKAFHEYGLEQMGSIAADYYRLTQGGWPVDGKHRLADFEGVLPLR